MASEPLPCEEVYHCEEEGHCADAACADGEYGAGEVYHADLEGSSAYCYSDAYSYSAAAGEHHKDHNSVTVKSETSVK